MDRKVFYIEVDDKLTVEEIQQKINAVVAQQKATVLPPVLEDIWTWNDIAGVGKSQQTMKLYKNLITEEYNEFIDAFSGNKALNFECEVFETEELDGCVDMIWVIMGYMRARGWSKETIMAAIEEVRRSNYTKFIEEDGEYKCIKRADGKIQKPEHFSTANLLAVIESNKK